MSQPIYFWSGSNLPGEIRALADHGRAIGISVADTYPAGLAAVVRLGGRRIPIAVARASGGRPILMFHRDRARFAGLPSGVVDVAIGGASYRVAFRAIAANVARAADGGRNLLGALLRRMLGRDAGAPGQGHRVILERTRDGWRMTAPELERARATGARVFVDSGAFREVAFRGGSWVAVHPIDHAGWCKRLDAYDRIARALGPQAYLVAPDRVGCQLETLRRLALYAPRVRRLRAMGAHIIVPIQLGAMDGAAFDAACSRVLGFSDYIRGIPSRKAAATTEQIGALCRALPPEARIHLLGIGPWSTGRRYPDAIAATGRAPARVSCDAARIPALAVTTGGPGGGPRILTKLTHAIRRELGLLPVSRRLPSDQSERVKYAALCRYFRHHYVTPRHARPGAAPGSRGGALPPRRDEP